MREHENQHSHRRRKNKAHVVDMIVRDCMMMNGVESIRPNRSLANSYAAGARVRDLISHDAALLRASAQFDRVTAKMGERAVLN